MKNILEKARYLSLVGVLSLFLASIVAYVWGAIKTVYVIGAVITSAGKDPYIPVSLIELVDSFLIATALLIFTLGLYELFIHDLILPEWMVTTSLHALEGKLGGVIIMVMVVKFLEHVVEWKDPSGSIFFAISVAVVSVALIALNHFGERH